MNSEDRSPREAIVNASQLSKKLPPDSPVMVEMVELKKLARARLPTTSALRDLILSEPDCIPDSEVAIKIKIYSRMLYHELSPKS
jgi:hypothetical protein